METNGWSNSLTEFEYNCIDTLATARNHEEMLREDRQRGSFLFDQAILGPSITMQLRGTRVDRAKMKLAEEETLDEAHDLQKKFEDAVGHKVKWGKSVKPSPAQLAEILYREMGVRVRTAQNGAPTVNKEAISSILEDQKTPDAAVRVAEIQHELAVLEEDQKLLRKPIRETGRMHSTWTVAGTTSGRFCLPPNAEILTRFGWSTLEEWDTDDKILCWDPKTDTLNFEFAKKVIFDNAEPLIQISSGDRGKFKLLCTEEHRLPARTTKGNLNVYLAGNKSTLHEAILSANYNPKKMASEVQTRIAVMVQADGHMANRYTMYFGFRKQRKINRCLDLLTSCGLEYTTKVDTGGTTHIRVPNAPDWMLQSKCFGPWLLNHNPKVFIEEAQYWDGGVIKASHHGYSYYSTDLNAVNWVQTMAHLAGRSAIIREKWRQNTAWSKAYSVYIAPTKYVRVQPQDYATSNVCPSKVMCAETVTGFFLVRCQGTISITGNSCKQDEYGFGANQQALSHRLHKIFVPDDGYVFINIDQKQAESRGVAYLSGCKRYKEMHLQGNVHVQIGQLIYPEIVDPKHTPLPWDENKQYYDLFKRLQHGSNYGQSPFGMARHAHMPTKEAESAQNKYFEELPEIRDWQAEIANQLRVYHSLTTPLGRRRQFLGRTWDDSLVKEAIAYIPQSMISQLNKIITWRIWNHFDPQRAQILMEGHDSNLFQVRIGDTETVDQIIDLCRIDVPIRGDTMRVEVEAQWGYSWAKSDLKDYEGKL